MSKSFRIPIDGLSRCLCPLLDLATLGSSRWFLKPKVLVNRRPRINCQSPKPSILLQRRGYSQSQSETYASKSSLSNTPLPSSLQPRGISDKSIEELHELLQSAPLGNERPYESTTDLVRYLISERGVAPGLIHYNALIAINADAKLGSAAVVEELVREMRTLGIKGDSRFFHNILQVNSLCHYSHNFAIDVLKS